MAKIPLLFAKAHPLRHLDRFFLQDSIFEVQALEIYAEMMRKAFGKNYRAQEIDFQVSEVPVSFQNPVLMDLGSTARCLRLKRNAATEGGLSLVVPPPRAAQNPGPRVLDSGRRSLQ